MSRGLLYGAGALALAWWSSRRGVATVDEAQPTGSARMTITGASGVHMGAAWKVAQAEGGGWGWTVEVPAAEPGAPSVVISSDTAAEALDIAKIAALEAIAKACTSAATKCEAEAGAP